MPIYEYHCPTCGADFERLVNGQTVVACPTCQSRDVRRTLSLFGVKTGTAFVPSTGSGCGCTPRTCGCH